MTKLTKPVVREITTRKRGRLIVRLDLDGVYLREPRSRTWFGPLDYGWLFMRGVDLVLRK